MKLSDGVVVDVPAVARDVIRQRGDDAAFHVAQLADAALERGEIELQRTLLALIREIEAILKVPPAEGVH
jgi:hypothetical protein